MKWQRGYRSDNVELRGSSGRGGGAGAAGLLFLVGRRFGLPGLLIAGVLFLVARFTCGGDMGFLSSGGAQQGAPEASSEEVQFVSFVFDDVQNTWDQLLREREEPYQMAKLVIFRQGTPTGCGFGQAAMGPFYCPRDSTAYIDLGFYEDLRRRFGAPGDFAQAYVIAHEIGHHVQNQLDLLSSDGEVGDGSSAVRQELQADCLAGVWAHSTAQRDLLEQGDLEEALRAAAAIGDDTLQRKAGAQVQPESWTHGSSEQRMRWFRRGYEQGTLEACDTRSVEEL
ncbi:neutral zinc metallopeptidase [Haliangium ochraceum]|uniref:Metalloprotease n=1 Tax=Haliangium ochraceum (strain DSM 14365 / JCM 11303 / SMP-2) TaxID=502025 RepID=D0LWG8_HALO1|nr:neutral zinc metallopeptidase [Haliangium ochraceum]ACY17618.1 protein of unknown function zinc metallopeptidase putative [Haliangium ochraceum DSM 14365]